MGPMADAPIFVVGVARSGTTLLSAMLSAHSRLDCGPESRFFARYRHLDERARNRILDPHTWPRPAVDFIASLRNQDHPITELFDLTLPEIGTYLSGRQPSVAAMLEALTDLHAHRAGAARWVEKTPRHLLTTHTLRALWPEARSVRGVRDPRDGGERFIARMLQVLARSAEAEDLPGLVGVSAVAEDPTDALDA